MKKLVLSILFLLGFVTNSYATGSVGFTISLADVNSDVKDDIDSNGTTNTTKSLSNDVIFGSVFIENAISENLSVGIDFIPFEAEFESRSTTQTSLKAKGDGAATSGTNKGTVDVSRHLTLYVQPQKELNNGLKVFGTLGLVRADVDSKIQSVSSNDKDVYKSKNLGRLKYSVPDFIKSSPELSKLIISIRIADVKDGGDGAILIRLKNL